MLRLLNRFRNLHWKFTLWYMLVTGALYLLVVFVFAFIFFVILLGGYGREIQGSLHHVFVGQASHYLAQTPPDMAALAEMLDDSCRNVTNRRGGSYSLEAPCTEAGYKQLSLRRPLDDPIADFNAYDNLQFIAVLDAAGEPLAVRPADMDIQEILAGLNASERAVLESALNGETEWSALRTMRRLRLLTTAALPIYDEGGTRVLGAVLVSAGFPQDFLSGISEPGVIAAAVALFLGAFVIALITSYVVSRGIVKRLRLFAESAEAWAQGDFSVAIRDNSQDEIGRLAQHLNSMAEQLQNLLETRSELAAIEERNRLARDLHDAAKQQIFAASMQLSTARTLFETAPEAAQEHLAEAERLVRQVRKELFRLIEELRPAQLEGKGLFEAVKEAATTFSRQNDIPVEVRLQGQRQLPLTLEQPMFRIYQEALNNIAKHSRAKNVIVHLAASDDCLTLTVKDDGIGFDPAQSSNRMGLQSMRERIAHLNGHLTIESSPQAGTTITAECPLRQPATTSALPMPERESRRATGKS